MAYIDYKCTIWNRVKIPDDIDPNSIINEIKDGLELNLKDQSVESLINTTRILTPEHNSGVSTIIVYDENDSILYRNGFEKTKDTTTYHKNEISSEDVLPIDWEDDIEKVVNHNSGYVEVEYNENEEDDEIDEINDSLNIEDINE